MRIVFCGTPDYAVPSLARLAGLAPRHHVIAVVSQPDRPKGRSRDPMPPPVVSAALKLGVPRESILQPKSINRPEALAQLRELTPDLLCVVAYGNLLKQAALEIPRLFALNAHGSLLPRHRGAAPIQAALLSGDARTGVSMMKMELGLDTGPVLLRRDIPIEAGDDAGTLHDKLAELSAACFVESLDLIERGAYTLVPQEDSRSSYAPKLEKDSGRVVWKQDAGLLARFIRAMNPWPGAWTVVALPDGSGALRVRVARATPLADAVGVSTGEARVEGAGDAARFVVGCEPGALAVEELQPEGKRAMSAAEFLRGAGRKFADGSRWG